MSGKNMHLRVVALVSLLAFAIVHLADAAGPIHSTPVVRSAGPLIGTSTNDSAAAGIIGQYVEATTVRSAAFGLTSTISANLASVSLTAGDWDVTFIACRSGSGSPTAFAAGISSSSATLPGSDSIGVTRVDTAAGSTVNSDHCIVVPTARISLAATTTYYGVVNATFTSTSTAFGRLSARRVR